jgi:hypothetical protein
MFSLELNKWCGNHPAYVDELKVKIREESSYTYYFRRRPSQLVGSNEFSTTLVTYKRTYKVHKL